MNDNVTAIVAMEAASAIRRLPKGSSIEDRFNAAAKVAKTHWLAPAEPVAFNGAVTALHRTAADDEKARIEDEAEGLKVLEAMLSGVPVDFERVSMPENPIGLMKLWQAIA